MSINVPPKLDYLTQYPVKNVLTTHADDTEGSEDGWAIEFDGGAIVGNHDASRPVPENLVGLSLLTVIYSEQETRMRFGRSTQKPSGEVVISDDTMVTLTPALYSLTDPRFGETVYPQRPREATDEVTETRIRTLFQQRRAEAPEELSDGSERVNVGEATPDAEDASEGV